MNEDAKRLLDALRGLVEQVESSNARDDHGHPHKNLKELHDARGLLDEIGGTKVEP
jgi:hypothetical protein